MGEWKELYKWNRKQVRIFITILTVMISVAVVSSSSTLVHASRAEQAVNTTLGENLEAYAGIFSTAVTASVNPTATLAALSILGMVENADRYFPEVDWLVQSGNFLSGIPFVRTISDLPIANPVAAILLTIVAITMYVIHSTSASKMFSKATIDNIEQWGGMIVTVALSLLPLATTQVVAAQSTEVNYVSPGTYGVTLILAILSAVFNAVVYICIYGCMDGVELLGAVIPIKGMNVVIEILKGVLHMVLLLLQIFSPILSVVVSILVMLVGVLLFRKMSVLSTYYMYIYVKPLWNRLWHKNDMVPFVHRKFPRKGHKRYPSVELAVPAFSMNQAGKIRKRELVWLILKDQVPYLVRMKAFRKPWELPLSELNVHKDVLYLQKTFRFTRILTEDRQVELIISNEYSSQWQQMLEWLQLSDFKVVEERKKQEKQTAKAAREEQRRRKREEQERQWEERMEKFQMPEIIKKSSEK
ncbi:MAG: hypothetical protein NC089_09445 [Bacteroides sp.]|nr:hypothetical protein [Bacteroides sp.]MCM1549619.1 hypothetical protein [Clostridium sp.]